MGADKLPAPGLVRQAAALEPLGKGILGTMLRYDYEMREEEDVFAEAPNPRVPKQMREIAEHSLETQAGHYDPEGF